MGEKSGNCINSSDSSFNVTLLCNTMAGNCGGIYSIGEVHIVHLQNSEEGNNNKSINSLIGKHFHSFVKLFFSFYPLVL